jgi:NADPH-dependent 7-cyano-7-deazaguanine reductase QueF
MALETINNPKIAEIARQRHIIKVPQLCPKTGNPVGGNIAITYTPNDKLLEVYSLTEYINSFIGHQQIRDIEHFTQVVAVDCASALGVGVHARAVFVLDIGQTVIVEVVA